MSNSTDSKVVVGMSGGVDSSVAAYILKEQGYDVVGITMKIWQEDSICCGVSAVEDARRVSHIIDIPYYVLNFTRHFRHNVVDNFISEYAAGRTPNPCIACNRYVKWEALLDRAVEIGAKYIATGHYAKKITLPNGRVCLIKANHAKDQTYALYNLTQYQLEHTIMPLCDMDKTEVRTIAASIGLNVANKPDSQEICFVPDNNYCAFIERETGRHPEPGDFIDTNGEKIGTHKGIIHYTIGQRKHLGMSFNKHMYVKKIDAETNSITLCENGELFEYELDAENVNYMAIEELTEPMRVMAKIRYRHEPDLATISPNERGGAHCVFDKPQRAITPGQAVVFYEPASNHVIGGGTIVSAK